MNRFRGLSGWVAVGMLLGAGLARAPAMVEQRPVASLRLEISASKATLVEREPLCLNVTLRAEDDVRIERPNFKEFGALRLYLSRDDEEPRKLDWEGGVVSGPLGELTLMRKGDLWSDGICVWWDFRAARFPFDKAGRYRVSAELEVRTEDPAAADNDAWVRVNASPIEVLVKQIPPEAKEVYDHMGALANLMASGAYGEPLREPLVKIVEESPDSPYARFAGWQLARVLAEEEPRNRKRLQEIKSHLHVAMRRPLPDTIAEESLRLLVRVCRELGQMDEARGWAKQYLELFPSDRHADSIRQWMQRSEGQSAGKGSRTDE